MKGLPSEHWPTPVCAAVWDEMSWGQHPFPAALAMVAVVVGEGRKGSSCHTVILGSGSQTRD